MTNAEKYPYLKKRALYELVKALLPEEDFPKCKDCIYRFSHGVEWLNGYGYKISSQFSGGWIEIERYVDDDLEMIRSDIYAKRDVNGIYQYHSSRLYPAV